MKTPYMRSNSSCTRIPCNPHMIHNILYYTKDDVQYNIMYSMYIYNIYNTVYTIYMYVIYIYIYIHIHIYIYICNIFPRQGVLTVSQLKL